ncbi:MULTISPECIES: nucleotide exchange factor GrpE [Bacteroides]|uniref:Protein GrpE n=1 Tax=Bacteroides gallinaceum TaxID=1462571 RepID=A0ABT7VC31_9BACE|nr:MULTISPECIES: nucleotide exchange factor GrpE [Bacteroides]MCR8916845.1 nucleotide exchange factor GrpE [Bacteroides sp. ET225]MDM8323837.1 nucleotide exchange factor GrpE [Bacteroides gallinaceum]
MDKENQKQNEEELKSQTQEAETANADMEEAKAKVEEQEEEKRELTPEEKLTEELEKAQRAIEEQKDKYLRLSAEFDNFRKRTMKEKAELIKNGGEKAINAVLPVLDDLERALQNMEKTEDVKAIYDGVNLIYQKFLKNLHQEGLEKMEPVGADFDTDYHEAIALVPAQSEEQKGKVLDCVQTGYKLNDKVIRHAKVVVGQ